MRKMRVFRRVPSFDDLGSVLMSVQMPIHFRLHLAVALPIFSVRQNLLSMHRLQRKQRVESRHVLMQVQTGNKQLPSRNYT